MSYLQFPFISIQEIRQSFLYYWHKSSNTNRLTVIYTLPEYTFIYFFQHSNSLTWPFSPVTRPSHMQRLNYSESNQVSLIHSNDSVLRLYKSRHRNIYIVCWTKTSPHSPSCFPLSWTSYDKPHFAQIIYITSRAYLEIRIYWQIASTSECCDVVLHQLFKFIWIGFCLASRNSH